MLIFPSLLLASSHCSLSAFIFFLFSLLFLRIRAYWSALLQRHPPDPLGALQTPASQGPQVIGHRNDEQWRCASPDGIHGVLQHNFTRTRHFHSWRVQEDLNWPRRMPLSLSLFLPPRFCAAVRVQNLERPSQDRKNSIQSISIRNLISSLLSTLSRVVFVQQSYTLYSCSQAKKTWNLQQQPSQQRTSPSRSSSCSLSWLSRALLKSSWIAWLPSLPSTAWVLTSNFKVYHTGILYSASSYS